MSSPNVYFSNLEAKSEKESILIKTSELVNKLYKDKNFFNPKDLVGIKIHFGEYGITTFLSPVFPRVVAEKIKEKKGNPFLFDTSTLYTTGKRTNAIDHLTTAVKNGFSFATLGAPKIIADGIKGDNYMEVKVDGNHFKSVKIAKDIKDMDSVIALSHIKGHCGAGFGGALKNISMGIASRAGKLEMHSITKPFVKKHCNACGTCIEICPAGAIEIKDKIAEINPDICIGCMRCDTRCPVDAIRFRWDCPDELLMEKMAEYAKGLVKLKDNKIAYMNFLIDITPDCDCFGFSNAPISPDIGVLASFDPVAIDQASVDLINKANNKDLFRSIWPKINHEHMLKYCEKIGVGTRKYNLVKI